jgi:hypothetical protein
MKIPRSRKQYGQLTNDGQGLGGLMDVAALQPSEVLLHGELHSQRGNMMPKGNVLAALSQIAGTPGPSSHSS